MSTNASYDLLSSLLPTTSFALAYALPLLFVSLPLTFAGAFLTLDRTRIFPSNPTSAGQVAPRARHAWLSLASCSLFLHGGIGGLCSGYAFGVHFTTFLSLLIPSTTSSSDLNPKSFSAIWILSVIACMAFAGRWKYAAIVLAGITGFATTALSTSVITHPGLITRIVLLIVFTTVGTVLCLLPFPRIQHIAIRFTCASAGSFGTILGIAILKRDAAWGNVWERVWVHNGTNWGTSQEKALSAGYCLLLCAGLACDTFLHYKFGENPDEKWDHYLAKYADNLPNDKNRAGAFTPFVSLYDRILGRDHDFAPIVPDQKRPAPLHDTTNPEKPRDMFDLQEVSMPLNGIKTQPGFLRKKGTTRVKGARLGRRTIKFQPGDEELLSSSDDEDYDVKKPPFVPRSLSSASSATLTSSRVREDQDTLKPPSRRTADIPDYSDYEEDLGIAGKAQASLEDPNWAPEFIRRHSSRSSTGPNGKHSAHGGDRSPIVMSGFQQPSQQIEPSQRPTPVTLSPDALSSVPATPSLIKAVDRITAAYVAQGGPSSSPSMDGLPTQGSNSPVRRKSWDSFWADVKAKAQT